MQTTRSVLALPMGFLHHHSPQECPCPRRTALSAPQPQLPSLVKPSRERSRDASSTEKTWTRLQDIVSPREARARQKGGVPGGTSNPEGNFRCVISEGGGGMSSTSLAHTRGGQSTATRQIDINRCSTGQRECFCADCLTTSAACACQTLLRIRRRPTW